MSRTFVEKICLELAWERREALALPDIRLAGCPSYVRASETCLDTLFTLNVPMKNPIASPGMRDVTGVELAISQAELGGIGVMNRALNPEEQWQAVRSVKLKLNGLITNPRKVPSSWTVAQVLNWRTEKGFRFSTFPVVDENDRLVGLMTRNDFDLCIDTSQPVLDVMTKDPISRPEGTSLNEAYEVMTTEKKKTLPLVDTDNHVTGLYVFSDVQRIKQGSSRMHNVDENNRLRVAAAVGTNSEAVERIKLMYHPEAGGIGVDAIVLDTSHGNTILNVIPLLEEILGTFPGLDVMAGNVSDGASAQILAEAGAHGVKVGQGGGSICNTSETTGAGMPQATAIYNCAKAISQIQDDRSLVPICADGAISNSGQIVLAHAAGADSVMLGRVLAATDESAAEDVYPGGGGKRMKRYRGEGSIAALSESAESRNRYGQDDAEQYELVGEGVDSLIDPSGPLAGVIHQLLYGLRGGMEHSNSKTIANLNEADLARPTNAGIQTAAPHGLAAILDAPRYQTVSA